TARGVRQQRVASADEIDDALGISFEADAANGDRYHRRRCRLERIEHDLLIGISARAEGEARAEAPSGNADAVAGARRRLRQGAPHPPPKGRTISTTSSAASANAVHCRAGTTAPFTATATPRVPSMPRARSSSAMVATRSGSSRPLTRICALM